MLPRIRWERQRFTRRQIPLSREAWVVNREGISLGLSKKIFLLRCPRQSSCRVLCPFSRAARSGFVLCHQTPPGKLGAALTESYDGRASQHQRNSNCGVLKPSRTLVSYLFIFICKSTHSNHRLLHSSGLPTRPQPPALCLFLLQPQLGFVGISKPGSESPRPPGSSTHLLRSCVHPLPQNNSWESSHEQHPLCTLPLGGGRQEKSPESSL